MPAKVVINEIAPNEKPDWVEFYNTNALDTASIEGFKYVNTSIDTNNIFDTFKFSPNTKIPLNEFLTLIAMIFYGQIPAELIRGTAIL